MHVTLGGEWQEPEPRKKEILNRAYLADGRFFESGIGMRWGGRET